MEDPATRRGSAVRRKYLRIDSGAHGHRNTEATENSAGELIMTKTAGELAAAIGADLKGDKTLELRGVAAPERAESAAPKSALRLP